nr:MAG TPA: hypothetical protein [Caudoviricetes sp.]
MKRKRSATTDNHIFHAFSRKERCYLSFLFAL